MNTYDIENKIKSLERAYNNLCCLIRKCLGIKSTGDSDKFLNQKGEWKNVSSSQLIIEVTYSELLNLISSNSLDQDTNYLITDFKTVHYIQYSAPLTHEEIHVGNTEPMIVTAVSNNELYHEIESTIYPEDKITWKPIFNDREYDAVLGQSTGVITSRYDTNFKIGRDYDWRNVIFRRWETTLGVGDFTSYTDTGFAYQDFPPFAAGLAADSKVGSPLLLASNFGIPYQLDNVIFIGQCGLNFIELGYACTFTNVVFNNKIGMIIDILHQGQMRNNNFGEYSSNSVTGTIRENNIQTISNNSISGDFRMNSFAEFEDNTIGGDVNNNIGTSWYSNTIGGGIVENNINIFAGCDFSGGIVNNNIQYFGVNEGGSMNHCNFTWFNDNHSSPNCTFESNNISRVSSNSFDPSTLYFGNNKGSIFQDNSLFGDFNNNDFDNLNGNNINGSVNNNKFLANIIGKTFTPTASMSSLSPTITLKDTTNGDVEQVLTGGVLSYTSF